MIKVLHKALNVLEVMSQSKKDVFTLNELANICNIPKSTLAGILKDLCEARYLEKDAVRGYRLGVMCFSLTDRLNIPKEVIEVLIQKAKEIHFKPKHTWRFLHLKIMSDTLLLKLVPMVQPAVF